MGNGKPSAVENEFVHQFWSAVAATLALLVTVAVLVLVWLGAVVAFGINVHGAEDGDMFLTIISMILVMGTILILVVAGRVVDRFRSGREPSGDLVASPDSVLFEMLRDAGVPGAAMEVVNAVVVSIPDPYDGRVRGRITAIQGVDLGGPVWWVHVTVPEEAPRYDRLGDVDEAAGLVATVYRRQIQAVPGGRA